MHDSFKSEQPYEDLNNIQFVSGGTPEEAHEAMSQRIPASLHEEFRRVAREVSLDSPFTRQDCETCHLMGAIGVQVAFYTDATTDLPVDQHAKVLKMCAPCTLQFAANAAEEIRTEKRDIGRVN